MSGYLEKGQWHTGWYDTQATHGEFVRADSAFRNWVTADGSSGYPAEPGRYHLYVSLACPWAHRTLIARALKKLDGAVPFTTLARFDAVYYGHFKCNRNRIEDFPHLSRYLRELYLVPGVAPTVNIDHIKRHYYMSHPHINPSRIVPVGPRLKFCATADRGRGGSE